MAIDAQLAVRLRPLRQHPGLRDFISEHHLSIKDTILPLFVRADRGVKNLITSIPGNFQWSVDRLDEEIEQIQVSIAGVLSFLAFLIMKIQWTHQPCSLMGVVQRAVQQIK